MVQSSQLKKKHNTTAYHQIREAIAADIVQFDYLDSVHYVADVLTNPLLNESFIKLVAPFLMRLPKERFQQTGEATHNH